LAFACDYLSIKAMNVLGDVLQAVLHREVAGVKPMHLRLGHTLELGFPTFSRKKDVVLSPENDRVWLPFPKERLHFG